MVFTLDLAVTHTLDLLGYPTCEPTLNIVSLFLQKVKRQILLVDHVFRCFLSTVEQTISHVLMPVIPNLPPTTDEIEARRENLFNSFHRDRVEIEKSNH